MNDYARCWICRAPIPDGHWACESCQRERLDDGAMLCVFLVFIAIVFLLAYVLP